MHASSDAHAATASKFEWQRLCRCIGCDGALGDTQANEMEGRGEDGGMGRHLRTAFLNCDLLRPLNHAEGSRFKATSPLKMRASFSSGRPSLALRAFGPLPREDV